MPDCLVLGGGIIGLSIAEQLTRLGQSVRLVAPFRIRQTASWAAAGDSAPPIAAFSGCGGAIANAQSISVPFLVRPSVS